MLRGSGFPFKKRGTCPTCLRGLSPQRSVGRTTGVSLCAGCESDFLGRRFVVEKESEFSPRAIFYTRRAECERLKGILTTIPLSSKPMDSPESNSENTPGSSSVSATPNRPSEPSSFWPLPRLFIFKPHPAWNSSQIDERCFIYCSQNSRNRAMGGDPWCRSICFRRVYGHEVHDESSDASNDIHGFLMPSGPLPLPPEGQPPDVTSQGFVENNEKTKYWKQGRYIWVSKSRWAAQEKLDSMTLSLPSQTAWMRYKEMMERQKIAEEMDGNWPANTDYDDDTEPHGSPESFRFPPSSAIRDSLLFPITPLPTMIREALHQKLSFILSPTYKILMLFGRSFTEGTQTRFLEKAYQQATNGSTLTLVRNVWSKHETWFKLEKEEERKKKGGGSEGLS